MQAINLILVLFSCLYSLLSVLSTIWKLEIKLLLSDKTTSNYFFPFLFFRPYIFTEKEWELICAWILNSRKHMIFCILCNYFLFHLIWKCWLHETRYLRSSQSWIVLYTYNKGFCHWRTCGCYEVPWWDLIGDFRNLKTHLCDWLLDHFICMKILNYQHWWFVFFTTLRFFIFVLINIIVIFCFSMDSQSDYVL